MKETRVFDLRHKYLVEQAIEYLSKVVFGHWKMKPIFSLEQEGDNLLFIVELDCEQNEAINQATDNSYCFIQGYLIAKGISSDEV
jgi:hypothetical protein